MKKPQNIYDNSTFYKEYKEMRTTNLNANELIEIPIIKSMLPNLKGKKVLDCDSIPTMTYDREGNKQLRLYKRNDYLR